MMKSKGHETCNARVPEAHRTLSIGATGPPPPPPVLSGRLDVHTPAVYK